jgi:hypothetical protein
MGEIREVGVSGWLGVDGVVEERLVLRVKDELIPLEGSFLDD